VYTHEGEEALSPGELVEICASRRIDLIVADRMTTVPAQVFESLPNLKAVIRCAVDVRNIDITAASRVGVLVTHAKPGFIESVAELSLAMMIDLARGISRYSNTYWSGTAPQAFMGKQLHGSTLGIVGYGAIARYLAQIAHTLGMNILVFDPYVDQLETYARKVNFHDLLSNSDQVVCLAVATDETENLFDINAFRQMKKDAYFINPSRGNLVDENALVFALNNGLIAGAALDVGREKDQMPTLELANLPNVVATPHIGGLTPAAIMAQALDTVEQVTKIVQGQVPHGSLNPESWVRRTCV
jgi:D-3-phosphoglycerate dehydrogenase